MHSSINYFIYITYPKITKCNTNLSIQTCWFTDWSFYRASALRLNHLHRSLSFNFTLCSEFSLSHTEFSLLSLYYISKLIYNLLLVFISNLKNASTWIDWLFIEDCSNYLPNNLASEINSTGLHCRIVDSFFTDRQDLWLV